MEEAMEATNEQSNAERQGGSSAVERMVMPPSWERQKVSWSRECYGSEEGHRRRVWWHEVDECWYASLGGFLLDGSWPTADTAMRHADRANAQMQTLGATWKAAGRLVTCNG